MTGKLALAAVAAVSMMASSADADTLAYWRFEDGTAGTDIVHNGDVGFYGADIADVSGNNNDLSVWETGGGAGYGYRDEVPFAVVPQTGAANNLSVRNTGGGPAMYSVGRDGVSSNPGAILNTAAFAEFTVEASWKPEAGGFRTLVGRDARDVADQDGALSALYLQGLPEGALAIKFADVDGFWHQAVAPEGTIQGFDFGTDPSGSTGTWYNIAAVSDGETLSLYLDGVVVASTDLTASGSTNTALTAGADVNAGDDWIAGGWSVGRGLFNGGHADRAYGFIDEVRISNSALASNQLLSNVVPEPTTATLFGLGALGLLGRRRR